MRLLPAALVAAGLLTMVFAAPVAAVSASAACPNSGLAVMPVVLVTDKGRYRYALDVAATDDQQQCGLMYRKAMPRGSGMIFPFQTPRSATFWMENTPLPLDLVFVGADDRVVSISLGKPYSRDLIDSRGIAASVIELNAGEARRIGLKPGDRIER
nr:DUF192 domain-containing protein [Polymorphobacter sp.]